MSVRVTSADNSPDVERMAGAQKLFSIKFRAGRARESENDGKLKQKSRSKSKPEKISCSEGRIENYYYRKLKLGILSERSSCQFFLSFPFWTLTRYQKERREQAPNSVHPKVCCGCLKNDWKVCERMKLRKHESFTKKSWPAPFKCSREQR